MQNANDSQMAGGQSCTYVGTEYEGPFAGQKKPLAAKVEYFDLDSIEALLRRLIDDYNTWNFRRPPDCDAEEAQELSRLSTTALNTFRSLFCDREECESPRALGEFLHDSFTDEGTNALSTMLEWCEELLDEKQTDDDERIEHLDAHTQRELLAQLDPLVSSSSRFEMPALWPLVKKVRYVLSSACRRLICLT